MLKSLADASDSQLPANRQSARDIAAKEYQNYLTINADWPSENVNNDGSASNKTVAIRLKSNSANT